jgi:hypothetical protein
VSLCSVVKKSVKSVNSVIIPGGSPRAARTPTPSEAWGRRHHCTHPPINPCPAGTWERLRNTDKKAVRARHRSHAPVQHRHARSIRFNASTFLTLQRLPSVQPNLSPSVRPKFRRFATNSIARPTLASTISKNQFARQRYFNSDFCQTILVKI